MSSTGSSGCCEAFFVYLDSRVLYKDIGFVVCRSFI